MPYLSLRLSDAAGRGHVKSFNSTMVPDSVAIAHDLDVFPWVIVWINHDAAFKRASATRIVAVQSSPHIGAFAFSSLVPLGVCSAPHAAFLEPETFLKIFHSVHEVFLNLNC